MGGPDIDARIDLMRVLDSDFCVVAAGSTPHLQPTFRKAGFAYSSYPLVRRVNPIADVESLASLYRLFRLHKPVLVHAFDTKPCVLARIAARCAGVPIIIGTLNGLGSLYADDNIIVRTTRAFYERLQTLSCHVSDLTIFQNHENVEQFISRGIVPKGKTCVIPGSGVRTDFFDPMKVPKSDREQVRSELGIEHNDLLVTMVARVIRSKGVREFALAAQSIIERFPQVKFLLVGSIDENSIDRLTSVELSHIRQSIIMTGARTDIRVVLAASDIFVLPSYREGIPRVLIEAASMGLPIVTTDAPGCNDVIEDGTTGVLVPIRDPHALSQAIIRLVENPTLRCSLARNARKIAITRFSLHRVADQLNSVYKELLRQKQLLPNQSTPHDSD